jgi:hypothetical protein
MLWTSEVPAIWYHRAAIVVPVLTMVMMTVIMTRRPPATRHHDGTAPRHRVQGDVQSVRLCNSDTPNGAVAAALMTVSAPL